jgi:hypothetical protein
VGIGPAGITSTQALAWRVVFQSPAADSVFRSLLIDATRPGQLYALAGLFLTDPAAYARAAAEQRAQGGEVQTQLGCIVSRQPVAVLLNQLDRGEWSAEFIAGRPLPLVGFFTSGSRWGKLLPNKRLKLAGADRSKGNGVFVPWRALTFVQQPCADAGVARSLSAVR